jgi:predicted Zn-dependent protease
MDLRSRLLAICARRTPTSDPWRQRSAWIRRPVPLVLLGLTAAGLIALGMHYRQPTDLLAARAALTRRQFDAARASLLRHLAAHPNSAESHLLMAQLDRRANNYAEAGKHLDACQRLGGPAEAIELERALAAIQNGAFNPALDRLCYEHLSRQDADQYLILEALSQGFTKTYRLHEARACLERMLVLQPDSNYALRRRAWIAFQDEQFDRAEADYRRALEIDPEDTAARLGLAQILLDIRKNGAEAGEQYERVWSVQHDTTVAVGLSQSRRLLGRGADARRLLDAWLADHPADALAVAERGRLALDEQATEEGVTLLRRAVTLAPYLRDANYTLYLELTKQGRTDEAEACQERMRQAKQAREELASLTRRLQQTPNDADLRCRIAQLFLSYGDEAEGLRWLSTILQNSPHHGPAHLALANYYDRHGQADRAAEQRRLAAPTP